MTSDGISLVSEFSGYKLISATITPGPANNITKDSRNESHARRILQENTLTRYSSETFFKITSVEINQYCREILGVSPRVDIR